MADRIRVGLVGANPDKGWGSAVHIPALAALDRFELTAVATTRRESAERSAAAFGAKHAFDEVDPLVAHPEVDLVVVSVKAPDHYKVAKAALKAGKHVYCEWPLAANSGQAEELASLAASKGLCAMVGLQARGAPALRQARELVATGQIGRVFAVRMTSVLPGGGRRRSQEGLYVIEKANGASTLAIQGGHGIDALRFVVGEIDALTSVVANQFDEIEVIETGVRRAKDAPDQVLLSGRLASGAVVSAAVIGGAVAGHGISLDIFGEKGTVSVSSNSTLNFQMSELTLRGAISPEREMRPLELSSGLDPGVIAADQLGGMPYPGVHVPRATLVNVANLYRELADAIDARRSPNPDFDVGLSLHRLLDRIEDASMGGPA